MSSTPTHNPMTPIIVGVGQYQAGVPTDLMQALSPTDIVAKVAHIALGDAGLTPDIIDVMACVRLFADSSPAYKSPLGGSSKFPVSVARRIGARPKTCLYESVGGQSPQHLVGEFSQKLSQGECNFVMIAGGEALANMKAIMRAGLSVDWSDNPDDIFEYQDRGFGDQDALVTANDLTHGLVQPMMYYGLIETARRFAKGQNVKTYQQAMGRLLAPFCETAAQNPMSMFNDAFTAEDIYTPSDSNRMQITPYLKHMVAKDGVNQSAAIIMTTVGHAKDAGIDPDKWVYLHGYADVDERDVLARPDISQARSLDLALNGALNGAGLTSDDISHFDIYSCFPIVVSLAKDYLGLKDDDPRALTQTGGLPFFGGPGNNYTLHGLAEMMQTLRKDRGRFGLVHGNGGWLSKQSVGVYSTRAPEGIWTPCNSRDLQAQIDAAETPCVVAEANGLAKIESYIVVPYKGVPMMGLVIGRLCETNERFYARHATNTPDALTRLSDGEVYKAAITVRSEASGNVFEFV